MISSSFIKERDEETQDSDLDFTMAMKPKTFHKSRSPIRDSSNKSNKKPNMDLRESAPDLKEPFKEVISPTTLRKKV
jgi:hypothetical protein